MSDAHLHLLTDSVRDYAFITFDPNGRITFWSAGAEQILGWTADEIVGQSADVIFTAEDREHGEPEKGFDQSRREGRFEDERWHVRRDGSRFWASGVITAVRDDEGRIVGFARVLRDLTDRKLRRSHLEFLDGIAEACARMSSDTDMKQVVSDEICRYLNLSDCVFCDLDESRGDVINDSGWRSPNMQDVTGMCRIEDYLPRELQTAVRSGDTVVVHDTHADPRTPAHAYAQVNIRSFVAVPVRHDGEWRFLLKVSDSRPRNWREDEIELLRDFADRWFPWLQRARAEAALRSSEQRYRALAELSPDAILVIVNGRCAYANAAAAGLVGVTDPQELVGRSPLDFLDPAWHEAVREHLGRVLEDGSSLPPLSCGWRRSDGTTVPAEVAAGPVSWHGAPGVQVVARDITERKREQEALRRSEERFRAIVTQSTAGIAEISGGRFTWVNDRFCEILARGRDDIIGRAVADISDPEESERFMTLLHEMQSTGEPFEIDRRYVRPDGSCAWVVESVAPVRETEEGISGTFIVCVDVTARKEMERALRHQERRFHTIANLVPDLLWIHDPQGETNWYNQRWLDYTGQTFEECCGFGWLEAIHPDDRQTSLSRFLESVRSGQPLRHEHRIRSRDGQYRWFLVQSQPLRDDTGQIAQWYGAATDIDEHRVAIIARERELDQTKDELQTLMARLLQAEDKERRRIARELHDDFSQRMAVMDLELYNLEQSPGTGASEAVAMARVRESLQLLSEDLRRMSHRLHPTTVEQLGLTAALQALVDDFGAQWPAPVDFAAYAVSRDIPLAVSTAIYRIVQEALRNITKYAPGAAVSVLLRTRDGSLELTIEDSGPGFDPGAVRTGSGLGLVSISERVRFLHGTLDIDSQPGDGTAILVRVPLETPPEFE